MLAESQVEARNPDELHDLLLDAGALPEAMGRARGFGDLFEALVAARRAARLEGVRVLWVAAERRSLAALVWPGHRFVPDVVEPPARRAPAWSDAESALRRDRPRSPDLPRTHHGGADRGAARRAPVGRRGGAGADRARGRRLAGTFSVRRRRSRRRRCSGASAGCWRASTAGCSTVSAARSSRSPPPTSCASCSDGKTFGRARQLHGQPGLARVIAQLQGYEAAAGAWERAILPARLVGYDSGWLDALCLSGGVAWGRLAARPAGGTPSRAAPIALCRRANLPWLLVPEAETERFDETALSAPARDVLAQLTSRGASFLDENHRRDPPAAHRGRGRARRAGLRGAGHGRRVLRSARADLGDADPGRRPRPLALPLDPPDRRPVGAGRWSILRA